MLSIGLLALGLVSYPIVTQGRTARKARRGTGDELVLGPALARRRAAGLLVTPSTAYT